MKNSILMLSAAAIIGVLGTLLLQPEANPKLPTSDNTSMDKHLTRITDNLNTLSANVADLQNLVQSNTNKLATQTTMSNNNDSVESNNHIDETSQYENFQGQMPFSNLDSSAHAMKNTQPTEDQINTYNEIETRLISATNNKTMDLSELIQYSEELTPGQRQELTTKAMKMIHDGELVVTQFESSMDASAGY